jgi:hypothetical protein
MFLKKLQLCTKLRMNVKGKKNPQIARTMLAMAINTIFGW